MCVHLIKDSPFLCSYVRFPGKSWYNVAGQSRVMLGQNVKSFSANLPESKEGRGREDTRHVEHTSGQTRALPCDQRNGLSFHWKATPEHLLESGKRGLFASNKMMKAKVCLAMKQSGAAVMKQNLSQAVVKEREVSVWGPGLVDLISTCCVDVTLQRVCEYPWRTVWYFEGEKDS